MAKKDTRKVEQAVEDARRQAVDTIIEMMENKGLYWTQEWSNAFGEGSMPRNGISGRWYAGGNTIHLMAAAIRNGWKDPRWFTFKQAMKLGFFPEKGSHGSLIEYYKRFKGMKDADGNWTTNEEEAVSTFSYMKLVGYFTVFNAEQLVNKDGERMEPEKREYPEVELDEQLCDVADRLIETSRCSIHEVMGEMRAYYSSYMDLVTIPSRKQFGNMEGFISTLTHEMTHSTCVPLKRDIRSAFGSEDYAFEELVAELGSTFSCIELGVHRTAELEADENFENHAAYIQSWLRKFRDDTTYLFKAASLAGAAASYIVGHYKGIKEDADDENAEIKVSAVGEKRAA